MSDVSGIPNMGFGGGNFFAPQFSYNPQMSAGQASAAYMPAENYAQNVTNNLFSSGGGFGRQTDYYSGVGAGYSAAGMSPYGVFTEPGAGGGGYTYGGGGNAPIATINNDSWRTSIEGPDWGGGGGLYSGSLSSFGGGGSTPAIDWSGVGQAAASMGSGRQDPYPNMSMPGGLSSPMSSPSGAQPFDWGGLFGGSARADPAPGMAMPGGLGSPMTTPFQSPSTDYNTFQGGGSSGAGGYTSGIAPDTTGGRDFEWPATDTAPGMAMPGGLGSPMTMPAQEPAKTQDQAPFDLSGPTTAWNNAPAAMPDTQAVLGYDPQQFAETDMSNFPSPANRYDMFQAGPSDTSGTGPSADKLAQDAREQLSDLISGAPTKEAVETAKAVEGGMADFKSPTNDYDKFQQPATYRTGYDADLDYLNKHGGHNSKMRPGGSGYSGIDERIHLTEPGGYKPLNPEFAGRLRAAAEKYESTTGKRAFFSEFSRGSDVQSVYYQHHLQDPSYKAASPEGSRHKQGTAGDIPGGDFRDWLYKNGSTYGLTFPVAGDKPHIEMSPSYQGQNFARPPADGPYPQGVPMPAERPAGAPERAFTPDPEALRPPMSIPPSEGGVPLPAARPAEAPGPVALRPSGVEKAQTFLNTSVEKLLQRYEPDKAGAAGMFIDTKQPLRDALKGPYGDQILAGLQPRLGEAGLTRNDLVKAIADPRARFMEGGDLGPYPAYTGPEAAPGAGGYSSGIAPDTTGGRDFGDGSDVYSQFRRSENVEDRRGETGPITDTPIDNTWWQNDTTAAPLQVDNMWPPPEQATAVPMPRERPANAPSAGMNAAIRDMQLTPQEEALYQRHLDNLFGPGGVDNPDGSRSTLYVTGENVDDKEYNLPTVYEGQIVNPDEAVARAKDQGLEKFPSYATPQEAEARYRKMHDYFNQDMEDYRARSGTSMRDFQSPATDYSAFQQPASRDALAKTMDFSGFSSSPEPRKGGVGPPVELTPEHMRTMAEIESTQNPKLQDPGSSYRGLYQLSDAEFKKYGGTGSIFDAEQNTRAAMGKMTAEGQRAQDILGRALTPVEQYMVHQQGLAGTLSHLQNPDQPAWKSFQQASQWSDARAKTAIWDNLSNAMKAQFGNDVNNITSRDFIDMWTTKYYQKMVASGLPPGGFSDLPQ